MQRHVKLYPRACWTRWQLRLDFRVQTLNLVWYKILKNVFVIWFWKEPNQGVEANCDLISIERPLVPLWRCWDQMEGNLIKAKILDPFKLDLKCITLNTLLLLNQDHNASEEENDNLYFKHCQRHNGPEGWVHITISYTNLDKDSFSESRPSIDFKIPTKHQHPHKTLTSKSWPNISISTIKLRIQNIDQTYIQNLVQDSTS